MVKRTQFMTTGKTVVASSMNTFSRNGSRTTAQAGTHINTHQRGTNKLSMQHGELRNGKLQFHSTRGQRSLAELRRMDRANRGHYSLARLKGNHAIVVRDPRVLKASTGRNGH